MKLYKDISGGEYILKLDNTAYAYRILHPKQGTYNINMSWCNDNLHKYPLLTQDKFSICKIVSLSGVDLNTMDYW